MYKKYLNTMFQNKKYYDLYGGYLRDPDIKFINKMHDRDISNKECEHFGAELCIESSKKAAIYDKYIQYISNEKGHTQFKDLSGLPVCNGKFQWVIKYNEPNKIYYIYDNSNTINSNFTVGENLIHCWAFNDTDKREELKATLTNQLEQLELDSLSETIIPKSNEFFYEYIRRIIQVIILELLPTEQNKTKKANIQDFLKFLISLKNTMIPLIKHSCIAGKKNTEIASNDILSAGELIIYNNNIFIDNNSGHYKPSVSSLRNIIYLLRNIPDFDVYTLVINTDSITYDDTYDNEKFLQGYNVIEQKCVPHSKYINPINSADYTLESLRDLRDFDERKPKINQK